MKEPVTQFLNSRTALTFVLILFAIPFVIELFNQPWTHRQYNHFLRETGEWSARLLIITLLISPLRLLFKKNAFLCWMNRQKRVFGVFTFIYSSIHLAGYFVENSSASAVISDLSEPMVLFGWIAFLIFIPLAITSNNLSVRLIKGRNWKNMQRAVYLAAVLVLLHWLFGERHLHWVPVLIHFTPLAVLEGYRIWHYVNRRYQKRAVLFE
jgi:sulfoxide reductase heme-binding subunit YedZ